MYIIFYTFLQLSSDIWFDDDSLFTDVLAAIKSFCYTHYLVVLSSPTSSKSGLRTTAGYHRSAIINNSRIVYRKGEVRYRCTRRREKEKKKKTSRGIIM
jgi:hypothetical protein